MRPQDLRGVFAVPPLARQNNASRALDFEQNDLIARHISSGGVKRLLYGGNAFLYHITLREFESLVDWLAGLDPELWVIPSIGPSFGRAMDQAGVLRGHNFTTAMVLPSSDPRDAGGLERGLREIGEAAGMPLVVYLKDETNFGSDLEAGLDAVGRLVDEGVCSWIKYAVVRTDPRQDAYLESLLRRVPRERVISGIGERPAIVHLRDFQLPGFTTGSGCLAPRLSERLLAACSAKDYEEAARLREMFLPHEDLRDAWGPARVLHHATELAGIARVGPIPPYVSPLNANQLQQLGPVAQSLVAASAATSSSTH